MLLRNEMLLKALYSVLLPLVNGFNINPALTVHLLATHHFRGAHMTNQATNNVHILQGTHLYTWDESRNCG